MRLNLSKLILLLIILICGCVFVNAQQNNGRIDPTKSEPNDGLRETLAKWRIKNDKKEYDEMIKRGEEALQIAEELNKAFAENQKLNADELKKLEKLEKLFKKIRDDLGGEEDKEITEKNPNSLINALNNLQETTKSLMSELKKTTRHSVSVIAIESSNALLKIVRFIRFFKK